MPSTAHFAFALLASSGRAAANPWEWAAVFDTSEGHTLAWTMQTKNGTYAAPHMKIVLLAAANTSKAALRALEAEAGHSFAATCTEVEPAGTLTPAEDTCYNLHLEGTSSVFAVPAAGVPALAIFAEHDPAEYAASTAPLHTNRRPAAYQPAPSYIPTGAQLHTNWRPAAYQPAPNRQV